MRKLKLWIVASASVLLLNLSSCASSTTSSVAEPVYTEKVTLSFMASQDQTLFDHFLLVLNSPFLLIVQWFFLLYLNSFHKRMDISTLSFVFF